MSAIVVGAVAGLELAWFERRPLFGATIVVTRAREQASDLRLQLEALGARVLELPAIAIEPVPFTVPDLAQYEWVVFTSVNGVYAWFERGFAPAGLDARAFAGVRIAAVTVISVTVVAAYVNAGGLGTIIFSGIASDHPAKILSGALAACLLAIAVDVSLAALRGKTVVLWFYPKADTPG